MCIRLHLVVTLQHNNIDLDANLYDKYYSLKIWLVNVKLSIFYITNNYQIWLYCTLGLIYNAPCLGWSHHCAELVSSVASWLLYTQHHLRCVYVSLNFFTVISRENNSCEKYAEICFWQLKHLIANYGMCYSALTGLIRDIPIPVYSVIFTTENIFRKFRILI